MCDFYILRRRRGRRGKVICAEASSQSAFVSAKCIDFHPPWLQTRGSDLSRCRTGMLLGGWNENDFACRFSIAEKFVSFCCLCERVFADF
jgi:hypothetical protein